MITRRTAVFSLAIAAVGLAGGSLAWHRSVVAGTKPSAIYTGIVPGVAVGGYDAVSYFTEGKARQGSADITIEHGGATWRFASAANRELFRADPARYAPQYGGYCAWAVAKGSTAKGDPEVWNIVEGRLYLNFDAGVKRKWERAIPANIERANANWPRIVRG